MKKKTTFWDTWEGRVEGEVPSQRCGGGRLRTQDNVEAGSTDWSQTVWVLVPVLSLVSCVALGTLRGLSVLQLSHLFHNRTYGTCWGSKVSKYVYIMYLEHWHEVSPSEVLAVTYERREFRVRRRVETNSFVGDSSTATEQPKDQPSWRCSASWPSSGSDFLQCPLSLFCSSSSMCLPLK